MFKLHMNSYLAVKSSLLLLSFLHSLLPLTARAPRCLSKTKPKNPESLWTVWELRVTSWASAPQRSEGLSWGSDWKGGSSVRSHRAIDGQVLQITDGLKFDLSLHIWILTFNAQ